MVNFSQPKKQEAWNKTRRRHPQTSQLKKIINFSISLSFCAHMAYSSKPLQDSLL